MVLRNFVPSLAAVLRHEGGYVDHPSDPGGATNKGITHKTLARWRHVSPWWQLAKSEVKSLEDCEISDIYRALYWSRCGADKLPSGLDYAVFDFAVNSGPSRSVQTLQAILKVRRDGVVGPVTLAAVQNIVCAKQTKHLVRALCVRRLSFLKSLKIFAVFGRGWVARVHAVQREALKMRPTTESLTAKPKRKPKMNILTGYKTYILGGVMLLSALAQLAGIDLPGFEGQSAAQLLMEGFAIVFLRRGIQTEVSNA